MKEYNLSDEMVIVVECVKASENDVIKKGLQDFFDVMENLYNENVFLHDKIVKQRTIIEKQEQEKFRIIGEKRKSKFEKFMTFLRSEKSGF